MYTHSKTRHTQGWTNKESLDFYLWNLNKRYQYHCKYIFKQYALKFVNTHIQLIKHHFKVRKYRLSTSSSQKIEQKLFHEIILFISSWYGTESMTQQNLHCTCTLKAAGALCGITILALYNGPVAVAVSDPEVLSFTVVFMKRSTLIWHNYYVMSTKPQLQLITFIHPKTVKPFIMYSLMVIK